MVSFKLDQELFLTVKVTDPKKADELMAWLYPEASKIDLKEKGFGCKLQKIDFFNMPKKYEELIEPIKVAVLEGKI